MPTPGTKGTPRNPPSAASRARTAKTPYMHARLEGWTELKQFLGFCERNNDPWLSLAGWRQGLTAAVREVHRTVKTRTPKETGALSDSINWEIQQVGVPRWGRVRSNPMPTKTPRNPGSRGGKGARGGKTTYPFRYGGALQGGVRIKYKYRSGAFQGQPTLYWFSKSRQVAQRLVTNLIRQTAAKMAERFNRPKVA